MSSGGRSGEDAVVAEVSSDVVEVADVVDVVTPPVELASVVGSASIVPSPLEELLELVVAPGRISEVSGQPEMAMSKQQDVNERVLRM